jgi:ABC-type glycerol-3-phosphate transport system substrate-binding protein
LGPDDLRRLLAEQDIVFVHNNNDAANAIVRGRGLVALSNHAGEALTEYKNAGLEVDIRPLGNGPDVGWQGTGGGVIAVYNQRPHPNAARLLVNWLASREVAVGLSRAQGLNSARKDVPPIDQEYAAIPGASYLNGQSMETMVTVNEWKRELKKMHPQ